MSESFWALPDVTGVKTPHAMLRDQADALTKQTNGRLEGWVENISPTSGSFVTKGERVFISRVIRLSIRIPALDNYTYRFLDYLQPTELYPGLFEGSAFPTAIVAMNETQFQDVLREALASETTKRIVGSLLVQANDAAA